MESITNGIRPIHPGEVLREEFLQPIGLTAHTIAMALQVPAPCINGVVRQRRAVMVNTALRLAKCLAPARSSLWASKPIQIKRP